MDQKDNSIIDDKSNFRRKFPRRRIRRKIGILCQGTYFVAEAIEIGEGGLAFQADVAMSLGNQVLINLQIPHGDFISERSEIKTMSEVDPDSNLITYGVSFLDLGFSRKRQIRAFVSARI